MTVRSALVLLGKTVAFSSWALLGAASTYGALYVFTPFGMMIFAGVFLIASLLAVVGQNRSPELWGLLGGPGIFCFVVAANAEGADQWRVAGAAFVAAAVLAFTVSGRARCTRNA
jgi:hypothetical protein